MANSFSLRSTSSGSSTSSLSSTFSDITSSSTSSSSPPNQKTNAFFASPFSTRPPSPSSITLPSAPAPPPPTISQNKRSLTAEFFGTPTRPPSPPASSIAPTSDAKQKTPHLSRIFPSRYTSVSDRHSSDLYFDSINDDPPDFVLPRTRDRAPSTGSESSSSLHSPRLPTPPPLHPHTPHREDTITLSSFFPTSNIPAISKEQDPEHREDSYEEPTPRPTSLQPGLLRFERELILQAQAKQRLEKMNKPIPPPPPEPPKSPDDDGLEDEEPHPGSIISLPSPSIRAHRSQVNSTSQSQSQTPPPLIPISPLSLTFTIASPSPTYAKAYNTRTRTGPLDRETPTPTPMNANGNESGPLTRNSSLDELKPLPSPPPLTSSSSSSSSHFSQIHGQPRPPLLSPKYEAQRHLDLHQHQHQNHQQQQAQAQAPKLRLLRPLGHGAFSAVWLAEDLSRVPLTLVSKKSVRDLRRRVSGRRDKEVEKERERDGDGDVVMQDHHRTGADLNVQGLERLQVGGGGKEEKADPSDKKQPQRPPPTTTNSSSGSRLKEGLRSMWSFSRSAATTVIGGPTPSPANGSAVATPNAGPGIEEKETKDDENMLSRNSSVRSTSSASSGSLSRQSSIRQGQEGRAHNPSLRLLMTQHPNPLQEGTTLSRDSSLRKFRQRVRGTRPAFVLGRQYLDERDGVMGDPRERGAEGVIGVGDGNGGRKRGKEGERNLHTDGNIIMMMDDGHDHHRARDGGEGTREEEYSDHEGVGLGASLSRHSSLGTGSSVGVKQQHSHLGRLVAVKMTPRRPQGAIPGREREEEERTRVGFVREVEVLKHISHPNITPLLAHLSTASRHILVLPYLPGGDLLGLVNNDVAWGMLGESVLRRIWCEICKAVGWMHGVGLVHRDIKLENVLLTTSAFSSLTPQSPRPTLSTLPTPPSPFIKLTDFGLSRFVEIDADGEAELLSTRCGSEAYAAPELVTGGGGGGVYDARKTDAWACGVVLYALVGRQLPFGEGVEGAGPGAGGGGGGGGAKSKCRIGGERGKDEQERNVAPRQTTLADRRHWLMRIARGEWEWPGQEEGEEEEQDVHTQDAQKQADELVGPQLVKSKGAKRIVSRLLVRDPKKRARVVDLWDDAWMQGGEDEVWWREREMNLNLSSNMSLSAPDVDMDGGARGHQNPSWTFDGNGQELRGDVDVGFYDEPRPLDGLQLQGGEGGLERSLGQGVEGEDGEDDDVDEDEEDDDDELDDEDEQDGCLFDHEPIDSITRQEVI